MNGHIREIVILGWGILSLWMILFPKTLLNILVRQRMIVSSRSVITFRLIGLMSTAGIVASLLSQR